MHATDLSLWGANDRVLTLSTQYPQLHLGRVITQERGQYTVVGATGERAAVVAGKLLYNTDDIAALPGVGDWVMFAGVDDQAIIQEILPRSSAIVRKAAGPKRRPQVIATNVDTVFICMALNEDFNLRRLERYLAVVWDSGASPVVVLTKADLAADLDARLREVESVAPGAELVITAALVQQGLEAIRTFITDQSTIAFIGSSGVGKSTLVNALVGEDVLRTSGLRNDGQGRHTTTHREAILLPGGGVLIDTPGMRELGIESADIDRTFSDIEELARQCRFSDCRHESEPGCAVRVAVQQGCLDDRRLASYHKLSAETDYASKTSRQIEDQKINRIFGSKTAMKSKRKEFKERNRNHW